MAKEFKLPKLGEDSDSGQVTKVLVSEGDTIEEEQGVIELETGKATVEVPSTVSGKVTSVNVSEGDEVKVGQVILTVGGKDDAAAEPAEEEETTKAEDEAPDEEEEREAEPEEEEEEPGAPEEQERPEAPEGEAEEERGESAGAPETKERAASARVPASPSVRRFAREIGVDLAEVSGSGPSGRVTRDDVKSHSKKGAGAPKGPSAVGAESPPLPDFGKWGETRREEMNNVRRMTAGHMAMSWRQIPHVTQHHVADITELEPARKKYGGRIEAAGGKLTVTAIAVKLSAMALRRFPRFNASLDAEKNAVVYKEFRHVGVAVDTAKGLLVPVIRDADEKTIQEIAVELAQLSQRAREGKIQPDDLSGATFTVTNLGSIGGTHFSPIVSFPQVAILGMGRASTQPVFVEGAVAPRLVLPLSLSYDHRVIDGAEGARFLTWLAESLENPLRALLGDEG